jgi:small-conductance mechanosensitive channel
MMSNCYFRGMSCLALSMWIMLLLYIWSSPKKKDQFDEIWLFGVYRFY